MRHALSWRMANAVDANRSWIARAIAKLDEDRRREIDTPLLPPRQAQRPFRKPILPISPAPSHLRRKWPRKIDLRDWRQRFEQLSGAPPFGHDLPRVDRNGKWMNGLLGDATPAPTSRRYFCGVAMHQITNNR